MSRVEIDPQQLASYDQAYAASQELLVKLVASYMVRRGEDDEAGLPLPMTIMSMVDVLYEHWDADQLVSALAAAVVMIAGGMDHLAAAGVVLGEEP